MSPVAAAVIFIGRGCRIIGGVIAAPMSTAATLAVVVFGFGAAGIVSGNVIGSVSTVASAVVVSGRVIRSLTQRIDGDIRGDVRRT